MEKFQNIYMHMEDDLSKAIYMDRLNYSITREYRYLDKVVDRTVRSRAEWKTFCEELVEKSQSCNMYIFGAGIWGNILYGETEKLIPWQGVIDNHPMGKSVADLKIMTLQEFAENGDENAIVVISSYKSGQSMRQQLERAVIPKERILDAGKVIYCLTEGAIYFDLEELKPQDSGEVFIDAGGFDGLTTRAFFDWCKGNGYSYCFEFDNENIASIERLFAGNKNSSVVPKALWSENTGLAAKMRGDFASCVERATDNGETREWKRLLWIILWKADRSLL